VAIDLSIVPHGATGAPTEVPTAIDSARSHKEARP
jgi:hypothetical protein